MGSVSEYPVIRQTLRTSGGFKLIALTMLISAATSMGVSCPGGIGNGVLPGGGNPTPTGAVTLPSIDVQLQVGQSTTVSYEAYSPVNPATVEVFVDTDSDHANGNEIQLLPINGQGQPTLTIQAGGSPTVGSTPFDTTGHPEGSYRAYVRITEQVSSGTPQVFIAASAGLILVQAPGSQPLPGAPTITLLQPTANQGLSTDDTVTVIYQYSDTDSPVTVTLLLDKDQNPTNDDINNPGDPHDPNTNIILLPSTNRKTTDPTFGGDPPPPDNPLNPPTQTDSLDIRRNPRFLPATGVGLPAIQKTYLFDINLSQIPPRIDGKPYYIRATITDGTSPPVHSYAQGSLTITTLAHGTTDLNDIGYRVAGARFQGFSAGEFLGTGFVALGDIDSDTIDDVMLVSRYGSPRNRFQPGAAYLLFGRRKTPFPPDRNGNGIPDVIDPNGTIVDFPTPPLFIFNPNIAGNVSPYDTRAAGRFGGTISVNSIGTAVGGAFYRGVTYAMPSPTRQNSQLIGTTLPPLTERDPDHVGLTTAGLTSVTRVNLTGNATPEDSTPDFIFGLPFISHPSECLDDDPCDTDNPNFYADGLPNDISQRGNFSGRPGNNDDMSRSEDFPIDTGLMIMVSGSNDLNIFRQFVDAGGAGQFDPTGYIDDEGLIHGRVDTPDGVRVRGAWETLQFNFALETTNEFGAEVAAIPSVDNDLDPDLLVSAPGTNNQRGVIFLWIGQDFRAAGFHGDTVLSIPSYTTFDCSLPARALVVQPALATISGAADGDRLSHPRSAGDVNQDGTPDVLCGAPAGDRDGLTDNGVFYLLFTPRGGFGITDLAIDHPPRVEIHGIHNGDRFGEVQDTVGDINGDGIADIAFASPTYRDDVRGNANAGFIGVIFGNRSLTGELGFAPEDCGTSALPGVRFFGASIGARAGAAVAGAGDFNHDGFGDLLIASPGETRVVAEPFTDTNGNGIYDLGEPFFDKNGNGVRDSETRKGVAYLIFGGPHLMANGPVYNLSQVGSQELPGLVFISPYVQGSVDEAPIETVAGVGDVDGDGFDDIMLGLPHADFVFPSSPIQRRPNAGEACLIYGNNLQ